VFKYFVAFLVFRQKEVLILKEDKIKKISYNTLIKNKTLSQFNICDKKEKNSFL